MPALIQGEWNNGMAEHRRIWPLVGYGAHAAIAAPRKETEGTPGSEGYETVREPSRTNYPAPDGNSNASDETCPAS
jgi:hypothetical protein